MSNLNFQCPRCHAQLSKNENNYSCHHCQSNFPRFGSGYDFILTDISNVQQHMDEDKEYWELGDSMRRVSPPLLAKTRIPTYFTYDSDRYVNSYYEYSRKIKEYELRSLDYIINTIRQRIQPDKAYQMLDTGCGSGGQHPAIIKEFPNIYLTGIEIVPGFVSFAQKHQLPNTKYHRGDGCHLPFPDNTFDIVFSQNAVEHAGLPLIQEMHRVQKPDGFSLLIGPGYISHLTSSPTKMLQWLLFMNPDIHGYKLSTYRKIIQEAGFQVEHYDAMCFNSVQRSVFQPWARNEKKALPPKWLVDFVFGFNHLMEKLLKAFGGRCCLWMQMFILQKPNNDSN